MRVFILAIDNDHGGYTCLGYFTTEELAKKARADKADEYGYEADDLDIYVETVHETWDSWTGRGA